MNIYATEARTIIRSSYLFGRKPVYTFSDVYDAAQVRTLIYVCGSNASIEEERKEQQRNLEADVVQFTRDWGDLRQRIARIENMCKAPPADGPSAGEQEEDEAGEVTAQAQETKDLRTQLQNLVRASDKIRADLEKIRHGWMSMPTGKFDKHGMPKMKLVRTFQRMPDDEVYDSTLKVEMDMEAFKRVIKSSASDAVVLRDFHKEDASAALADAQSDEGQDQDQVMAEPVDAGQGARLVDMLGLEQFDNDAEAMDAMLEQFEEQVRERMARNMDDEPKQHERDYECLICGDDTNTGVLCAEEHFMCLACFSNYLDAEAFNIAGLRKNHGCVACPSWVAGCNAPAFTASDIDKYVTEPIREKLEDLRKRVEDIEATLGAHGSVQYLADPVRDGPDYIRKLKEQIEAEIMIMRCPKCR